MIVHHAGRSGEMRGTSKREDNVFWIIALDDMKKNADDKRGARFISHFTKPSRNTQHEVPAYEWHFVTEANGDVSISHKQAQTLDVFLQIVRDGVTECDQIAAEMKVPKYVVSRLAKKAMDAGWLRKRGRNYEAHRDRERGREMKNFVARVVAVRCTLHALYRCNLQQRQFPGGFTYETPCCTPATNPLKNEPLLQVKTSLLQPVAGFVAPRFPIANTSAMNGIEALTLRIREVRDTAKTSLRISAPVGLVEEMIVEFQLRGETPVIDDDVVRFGPFIVVYLDDSLPEAVFKIESRTDCDLDGIT